MSKVRIVKPAAGRRVVNPATMTPLPGEGAAVEWGTFWIRRLRAGDIEVAEEAARPAGKTAKPASSAAAKE